jgi:Dyp-type peroxidase family
MDAGPVSEEKGWPSWKLDRDTAADTQGLVLTGFGNLPAGRALMLRLTWDRKAHGGGAWLDALQKVVEITSAEPPAKRDGGQSDDQPRAAALAISWAGLQLMGLGETALASFSRPFREGMLQEDRLRRLGDRRNGKWQPTVLEGGPLWSANTPERPALDPLPAGFDVPSGSPPERPVTTDTTVHAILLLYTRDMADAEAWDAAVVEALAPHAVEVVRRRDLFLDPASASPVSREHFGFADGLSQPAPYDGDGHVLLSGKPVTAPHPVQGVPLGEILFSYTNGHGEPAPTPTVPDPAGGLERAPDPAAAGLKPHWDVDGFYDLGRNGSYMVVRELSQDVAAFWNSMDANAERIRTQDPTHSGYVTADWLAERVIGRDKDGHLLCPADKQCPTGKLAPDKFNLPDNDFHFWERDRYGFGCPAGSHVRRANPRDSLAPGEGERAGLLHAANNHRILRRGRKYGPPLDHDRTDDGEERGLLFVCLNTDIARQFEFVQQTWLLNSTFATLYQEVDPLLGAPGPMTIREDPLRRILHIDTYVRMIGGDYFFLPSLTALRYLAML